jgi:hypothetical protein
MISCAAAVLCRRGRGSIAGTLPALHRGVVVMLTAPALTLLFLGVVVGLGAALVWMFWEIEQAMGKPHRDSGPVEKTFLKK